MKRIFLVLILSLVCLVAGAQVNDAVADPTLTNALLAFLSGAGVRAILVMFIIAGIFIEMHTPGFGFAAAIAVIAATLYFLPGFIAGTLPAWILVTFAVGVVFIGLEVLVFPGLGFCGVVGTVAVSVAVVGAMTIDTSDINVAGYSLGKALLIFFSGLAGAIAAVAWLTSKHGPKCFRKHSELMAELSSADGFVGVDMSPAEYIGEEAETLTDLRPAGKIKIGNEMYDAVSMGAFIAAGKRVKITRYENAQLYVIEI